jgi:flagellar hook-associated protein 3 FlgL
MRVTANAFDSSLTSQLNVLTARQYALQGQVSSGLKVAAPEDDPAAMANTLGYQAQNAAQTQYSSNISTLLSRAGSVYNVLQSLQTVSSRAGEIATTVGGATNSQSTLDNYANEVNHLISQVVTAANTKDPSTGQYLFGGTASTTAPFTTTTDANGNVTGVTYNGNSTVNQAQIGAGMTATADIPGANTGSTGAHGLITDSQSGADLVNHLIALRNNLTAGNTTAITATDSANLQKDQNNVAYQVANNGVVQSQLNVAATIATNRSASLNTMISNTSSADLVQTMMQLSQTQTAYQAALQSGAKIMQLSILNYIS